MDKLPLVAFIRLRIIPQVILIEAYIIAKMSFVLFEIFTTCYRQKVARAHPNYSICCLVAYCSGMVCGCGCCCLCCCNCCRRKPGTWSTALTYYINLTTRINCYFVKLLLGPGTIVSRKSAMHKKEDVDKYGVSKLYLRNKVLSHREVSAFAVITFTFGLIVLIAVWTQVLHKRITSTCSVEVGTSCYPLLSDKFSSVDFAVPIDQPIDDCSYWNSENVSTYVERFQCFQLRFDLLAVLSRFGGLLSLMLLVLRITFSLALAIIDSIFENFLQSPDDKKCWYKTKLNTLVAIVKTGRIFLAYIAYLIEILSINIIPRYIGPSPYFEIGFEVVLGIGLLTSCLLMPLEEYSLAQDHARGGVTLLSRQQSADSLHATQPPKEDENDSFNYHKLQSFDSVDYQRDVSEA
jgi:hypothetical protein